MKYLTIESLIEKVNRDLPDSFKYNVADLYEWVWEVVSMIGSEKSYIRKTINVSTSKRVSKIPDSIRNIVAVKDLDGNPLIATRSRFKDNVLRNNQYIINGSHIITSFDTKGLEIDALIFPVDNEGKPLIIDKVYVIEAVSSYILYKIAKKRWLMNNLSTEKYREFESDWNYNSGVATNKLLIPNEDEMRQWNEIHDLSSGLGKDLHSNKDEEFAVYNSTATTFPDNIILPKP